MVPHLITALTGPINELEQRVLDCTPAIERWFRLAWREHSLPFYGSVDIRNAGFKLSPVDINLYPVGWHHLTAWSCSLPATSLKPLTPCVKTLRSTLFWRNMPAL